MQKDMIIQVKEGIIKPVRLIGDAIFMMRMAISILRGLHSGNFSVSELKERR